jgi:hypothetical protein
MTPHHSVQIKTRAPTILSPDQHTVYAVLSQGNKGSTSTNYGLQARTEFTEMRHFKLKEIGQRHGTLGRLGRPRVVGTCGTKWNPSPPTKFPLPLWSDEAKCTGGTKIGGSGRENTHPRILTSGDPPASSLVREAGRLLLLVSLFSGILLGFWRREWPRCGVERDREGEVWYWGWWLNWVYGMEHPVRI